MQTSENHRMTTPNHRKVQASTTLSRRYTKRPARSNDVMVKVKRSPKVQKFSPTASAPDSPMVVGQVATPVQAQAQMQSTPEEPMVAPVAHPLQDTANARMRERTEMMATTSTSAVTAKQLKDRAIQKALASAENIKSEGSSMPTKSKIKSKNVGTKVHFGFGRVLLAATCAAAAVFAIVYFVNLNMPDISLRVAAMQTGIDPSYPNYVPRDYNVSSITSENGKITMEFVNNTSDGAFTLIEEKSSWDTNALLSNFVKDEYGENYTIVREQGLTIYISGSNAAWVNGGNVFKIKTTSGSLTNKQIRSIATSL